MIKVENVRLFLLANVMFGCGPFQIYHNFAANNLHSLLQHWIKAAPSPRHVPEATLWTVLLVTFFLSSALSTALFAVLADRVGRRNILKLIVALHFCAQMASFMAHSVHSYYLLVLQRLFLGLAYGLGYGIAYLFGVEMPHQSDRGFYCALGMVHYQVASVLATLITLPHWLGTIELWQYSFMFGSIPALLLLFCLPYLPESPRYLYFKNQDAEQCMAVLSYIQNSEQAKSTFAEIKKEYELLEQKSPAKMLDLWRNPILRKCLILSMMLVFLMSFTGLIVYPTFSTRIFESAGYDHAEASFSTFIWMLWKTVPTVVLVPLSDILGRRYTMLVGCALNLCAQMGVFVLLVLNDPSFEIATEVFVCLMLLACGSRAIHMVVHTITGELFPQTARAEATAVIWTWMLLSQALTVGVFAEVVDHYGIALTNLLFTIATPVLAIYAYKYMPETSGKSFEEIYAKNAERVGEKRELKLTNVNKETGFM